MSELSRDARAFIDAARPHERATEGQRRRVRDGVLRSVGAAAVVAVAASATVAGSAAGSTVAGTTAPAVGGGLFAKLVAGACVLAALGGVGALTLRPGSSSREPARLARPEVERAVLQLAAPSPSSGGSDEASPERSPEEAVPSVAPDAPARESSPRRHAGFPPRSSDGKTQAARPSLDGELGLLQGAQDQLRSGHAARALELLDAHKKRFGDGALREERQAARVLALCKLGRVREARAAAAVFLRESPESPQAARVRGACAQP